jgi:hypothetical protein
VTMRFPFVTEVDVLIGDISKPRSPLAERRNTQTRTRTHYGYRTQANGAAVPALIPFLPRKPHCDRLPSQTLSWSGVELVDHALGVIRVRQSPGTVETPLSWF